LCHCKQHLRTHHSEAKRPLTVQAPQNIPNPSLGPLSHWNLREKYNTLRCKLVKSVIYRCLAFSCVEYEFFKRSFENLGYDKPSRNTIKKDIECASLVEGYVRRILSSFVFFTLEFDLWTSLCKDCG
jgi:hypothetical protein